MAFGKKKTASVQFDQSNVSMLASQALAEKRAKLVRLAFRITGETPLLMQRWTQKAIIQMLGKMVGQPVPREPKDLTKDFHASYFRNEDGQIVVPCRIVKAAIVNGAIVTDGLVSKAELKRSLRVVGHTSPIRAAGGKIVTIQDNGPMEMDCRIVSNNGTPDVRARAVIPAGYTFDVVLQFSTALTPDKVVAALEGAGSAIGLCEWRPENGGEYGTFKIDVLSDKDIARIMKECASPEEEYKIPPEFLRPFAASLPKSDAGRKALAVVRKVNGDARKTVTS